MARAWYGYIGLDGGEKTLSNYVLVANPAQCAVGNHICAVYAPGGGRSPLTISQNLITYITNAKMSGIPQPTFPPNSQIFVYVRP